MARLLIVEDEVTLANVMAQGLREEHHFVEVHYDGRSGLQAAQSGNFDVIILDLMLPKLSGIELCERLRKDGNSTPIIMVTARDTSEDIVHGIQTGANDYIKKPFAFDELLVRIQSQIRDHSSRMRNIDAIGKRVVAEETSMRRKDELEGQIGRESIGTVLFLDIRGYTALSQTLELEEGMRLVNKLFQGCVPIIEKHGGIIDKFLGDGFMALFGVPESGGNDPVHAANAALDVQAYFASFCGDAETPNAHHVEVGIGISQGPLISGNVGSKERYSFTALGPTVNLAARLCGVAAGGEILCDEGCRDCLDGHVEWKPGVPVELKGIDEPLHPLHIEAKRESFTSKPAR